MTTPPKAIAQGIFDIIVEKAAGMPRQSRERGSRLCSYRGAEGNRCFAGWILPDEAVTDDHGLPIEGDISVLLGDGKLPTYLHDHVDLLLELQKVHDCAHNWTFEGPPSPRMKRDLLAVARKHDLKPEIVDTHFPA